MKKNVKMTLVASTAALALAASFMGCKQPTTPAAPTTNTIVKDIAELPLKGSNLKVESQFGRNIITFNKIDYATKYELYRFGPMDYAEGKLIFSGTQKDEKFHGDEFYYDDVVTTNNPMYPGSYTYKLKVSGPHTTRAASRAATIGEDKVTTAPTILEGDFAQPDSTGNNDKYIDVDHEINTIPSVAEVTVNVSEANMPPRYTPVPISKSEFSIRKGEDGDKGKYMVVPGPWHTFALQGTWAKEDEFNNLNSTDISSTKPEKNILVAKANEWWTVPTNNYYTKGTCKLSVVKTFDDRTSSTTDDWFLPSKPLEVETIDINVVFPASTFEVTANTLPNGICNSLTWTLDKKFENDYDFAAKRALISKAIAPNKDGISTEKTIYSDLKPVTFDITSEDVFDNDGLKTKVKYTAVDKTAEDGKSYIYFYTFTAKDKVSTSYSGKVESLTCQLKPNAFKPAIYLDVIDSAYACKVEKASPESLVNNKVTYYSTIDVLPAVDNKVFDDLELAKVSHVTYVNNKIVKDSEVLVTEAAMKIVDDKHRITIVDSTIPFFEDVKDPDNTKFVYNIVFKNKAGELYEVKASDSTWTPTSNVYGVWVNNKNATPLYPVDLEGNQAKPAITKDGLKNKNIISVDFELEQDKEKTTNDKVVLNFTAATVESIKNAIKTEMTTAKATKNPIYSDLKATIYYDVILKENGQYYVQNKHWDITCPNLEDEEALKLFTLDIPGLEKGKEYKLDFRCAEDKDKKIASLDSVRTKPYQLDPYHAEAKDLTTKEKEFTAPTTADTALVVTGSGTNKFSRKIIKTTGGDNLPSSYKDGAYVVRLVTDGLINKTESKINAEMWTGVHGEFFVSVTDKDLKYTEKGAKYEYFLVIQSAGEDVRIDLDATQGPLMNVRYALGELEVSKKGTTKDSVTLTFKPTMKGINGTTDVSHMDFSGVDANYVVTYDIKETSTENGNYVIQDAKWYPSKGLKNPQDLVVNKAGLLEAGKNYTITVRTNYKPTDGSKDGASLTLKPSGSDASQDQVNIVKIAFTTNAK